MPTRAAMSSTVVPSNPRCSKRSSAVSSISACGLFVGVGVHARVAEGDDGMVGVPAPAHGPTRQDGSLTGGRKEPGVWVPPNPSGVDPARRV